MLYSSYTLIKYENIYSNSKSLLLCNTFTYYNFAIAFLIDLKTLLHVENLVRLDLIYFASIFPIVLFILYLKYSAQFLITF